MEQVSLRAWAILAACVVVAMLNDISGAVLTLAMPQASRDVAATGAQSQLILLLGKLCMGALLLAGGGFGDRFGRKRLIVLGAGVVAVAAILCAIAPSPGLLAAGRALDGVGNAMIGPLALAICVVVFPEAMRGRVIGLFLGATGASVIIGPFLAGFIIEAGGWRLGFVSPLVLALLSGAVIAIMGPSSAGEEAPPRLDLPGTALCVVGLVSLVLGLVLAGGEGLSAGKPLLAAALGLGCLALFVWWELRRAAYPLIDRRLLTSPEVLFALAAALLMAVVLNGTVLPLFYYEQRVQGSSPVTAVLRLSPLIFAALLVAPFAGGVADRHGRRPVMTAGLVLVAAGSALLATVRPEMPYLSMLAGLVLCGAGVMMVITPAADLVMATTGKAQTGSAAALTAAVMQVGGAIGIGVITAIFIAAAEHSFRVRVAALGVPPGEIGGLLAALRQAVRDTTLHEVPVLPMAAGEMHASLLDAYARAAAAGVARSFVVAGGAAVAAIPMVLLGMRRPRADRVQT